jgi:hypothetical protein
LSILYIVFSKNLRFRNVSQKTKMFHKFHVKHFCFTAVDFPEAPVLYPKPERPSDQACR